MSAEPNCQPRPKLVGVADAVVADAADGLLVTYALGSCVGVTAWDPVVRVGGLLHFLLPQPGEDADRSTLQPNTFATTGLPLLFRRLGERGAQQARLVVCAAGGAEILDGAAGLAIGARNRTALRKILWRMGVPLAGEAMGGDEARSLSLDLSTGAVCVRTRLEQRELWAPSCANR